MTRTSINRFVEDDFDRQSKRVFRFFVGWFAFCLLLSLGLLATIIYVVGHFLAKVW